MIREIRIKNFESHADTILNGFSDGFNLFYGDSNSGKTAIIRAVRLIAQNQFNPKSVRIGHEDCEVMMKSDRGVVKVTRGKSNTWETNMSGEEVKCFQRIGKGPLREAVEILGLGEVELGDMSISANIMDQLESHFMLAELDGKSVSGSMRAQVIDEISGLSGIETIIRDVSLENHRLGKKISGLEEDSKEFRAQMHDGEEIEKEGKVLEGVDRLLEEHDEMMNLALRAEEIHSSYVESVEGIKDLEDEIGGLPDIENVGRILKQANEYIEDSDLASEIYKELDVVVKAIATTDVELEKLPDTDGILVDIEKAIDAFNDSERLDFVFREWEKESLLIKAIDDELEGFPDTDEILECVERARGVFEKVERFDALIRDVTWVRESVGSSEKSLELCEIELREAYQEQSEALESIEVCPVTGKAIGRCFTGFRIPVTDVSKLSEFKK